jgi:hypothetical protein
VSRDRLMLERELESGKLDGVVLCLGLQRAVPGGRL